MMARADPANSKSGINLRVVMRRSVHAQQDSIVPSSLTFVQVSSFTHLVFLVVAGRNAVILMESSGKGRLICISDAFCNNVYWHVRICKQCVSTLHPED